MSGQSAAVRSRPRPISRRSRVSGGEVPPFPPPARGCPPPPPAGPGAAAPKRPVAGGRRPGGAAIVGDGAADRGPVATGHLGQGVLLSLQRPLNRPHAADLGFQPY